MPRLKEDTRTLLADLTARLDRLVATARKEGREDALSDVRNLVGGAVAVRRGPGRPPKSRAAAAAPKRTKSGKKRKNPWASMTPEQKAERVKKMLAGRGLKPKNG